VSRKPLLLHVTTTDISLSLLLGPQFQAFKKAGYDVLTASAPGPYVAELEADGIPHLPLQHATRSVAPSEDLRALGELYRLFREHRPDIVHTHNPKPGVYGRLAGRASRVPLVVNTVHGLYAQPEDHWRRKYATYAAERVAATCSYAELIQNEEDVATLARLRVPARKLVHLGNGVDRARFDPARAPVEAGLALRASLGVRPDELLAVVVARLVWEKGYREVFEAARLLRARGTAVRIAVVGPAEPAKADEVDEASMARAAEDGVLFLGYRSDVETVYAASDVFIMSSYREGVPRAAMEAATMGLPLIATDVRGGRQVVEDGRTGIKIPPRDAPAMAAALEQLAGDAALRATMGAAGREKSARDFDQENVIRTTLRVYAEGLAAAGSTVRAQPGS
jgi:glycosyltransferase involved in cell wall biosynthesis